MFEFCVSDLIFFWYFGVGEMGQNFASILEFSDDPLAIIQSVNKKMGHLTDIWVYYFLMTHITIIEIMIKVNESSKRTNESFN